MSDYTGPVIGLEIHIQVNTRTKLFCSCPNDPGAEPNTATCPVCLGHPGTLPVLNQKAVEAGIGLGLALNCEIRKRTIFYRKNYFYPDLAKGYQITQHISSIAGPGELRFRHRDRLKSVRITGIAIEEEAAKTVYTEDGFALLDFNRAGVPLLEVVTEPDIRSPGEARAFLEALRLVVRYLGISQGDMEKGQMRVDVNVSYMLNGQNSQRVEIKNVNTFKAVEQAAAYEAERIRQLLEKGEGFVRHTRTWDEYTGQTVEMRTKDTAQDYRFFPEPDLRPLVVSEGDIERARQNLPALPEQRYETYTKEHGLSPETAKTLISSRELAEYYEAVAKNLSDRKRAGSFVAVEVIGTKNGLSVQPEDLARLLGLVEEGKITFSAAKEAFHQSVEEGVSPLKIVEQKGLTKATSQQELHEIIDRVIAQHPQELERYRAGKTGLLGFFIGQVMKSTEGRADPKTVKELLNRKLQGD